MGEDSACIYEYGWRQCLYLWVWVKTVLVSMSMKLEDSRSGMLVKSHQRLPTKYIKTLTKFRKQKTYQQLQQNVFKESKQ